MDLSVYENFRMACMKHGTALTAVLHDLGKSDGSTGNWKKGKSPSLDTTMEIANHLRITLDELVYGEKSHARYLSSEEVEWLSILFSIPADRRAMCKDFLKTHMVIPDRYEKGERVS